MTRVWITRDEPDDGPLSTAMRDAGVQPVLEPVITRVAIGDARNELARLTPNDWLLLTSAFAVNCIALEQQHFKRDDSAPFRIAVVGEATADAVRERSLSVEHIEIGGGAAALFDWLAHQVDEGIVCYPRSSLAAPPAAWANVTILSPIVYETDARDFDRSVIEQVDIAAVASPSAVRAIGRVSLPLASIGPTTSAALREMGMEPAEEAEAPTFAALAAATAALGERLRAESQ